MYDQHESGSDPHPVSNGMKLLIATGLYPPEIGGPATYTLFLERLLKERGAATTVVPFRSVRHMPKIVRHIVYTRMLIRALRTSDFILALDTVSVGVPALLSSIVTKKPLYLRVPGDYAWEQGQQRFGLTETLDEYLDAKKLPLQVRVLKWLQNRVAKGAARIIVPSEYLKRVVMRWGVPSHKIVRVYSALHHLPVTASKDDLRTQLGITGFMVTTAARLVPWKGIAEVIRAVAVLQKEGLPITLSVFGDGTERKKLELLVEDLNAQSYIHFHGSVERAVLGKHIKASDVFVLNTSYEGLSHQLIEVMHLGTPIVTTPVGGNTELISPDVEGVLVSVNDIQGIVGALRKIATDRAFAGKLCHKAREKVRQFDERTIETELYDVLSGGREQTVASARKEG